MTHPKVQIVLILENKPSLNLSKQYEAQRYSLLLLQTNKKRGCFWQNITGSVEKEDGQKSAGATELTWLIAAQRELFEETQIKLSLTQFIDLKMDAKFTDIKGRNVEEKCFLATYKENKPEIIIDPKEHQNYRWVSVGEVQRNFYKYGLNYECFLKALEILRISPNKHQIDHYEEE